MENEDIVAEVLKKATIDQKTDYDCGFSSGFFFPETPVERCFTQNTWYSFGHSEGIKASKKDRLMRLIGNQL